MKKQSILFLSVFAFLSNVATAQMEPDDCSRILTTAQAAALRAQQVADSIRLSVVVPSVKIPTVFNAVPSGLITDLQLAVSTQNSVSGFFKALPNADHYLVLISEDAALNANPLDGVHYNIGDRLGNSIVINSNDATSFMANNLQPGITYTIHIFAANTNTDKSIIYTPTPVYKTDIVAKTNGTNNYYFGNLHSHSSYSDGNKDNQALLPADDYAYAKNSLCMDFLGISEHNHFSATNNPGMHRADYQPGLNAANTFTNSNPGFLALYGMEWGVISNGGHIVIYGVDSLIGWETLSGSPNYDIFVGKYDYTGLNGLFDKVNHFAAKKAFASFAHPDDYDYNDLKHIAYDPLADDVVTGSAIESGPAFSTNTTYTDDPNSVGYLSYFNAMLAKGYHLGPTIDQDTHYLTFGRNTKARLVVLAPSINSSDFYDAMRAMHFYATEICDTKVDFSISGEMMGAIFTHKNAPSVTVNVSNATYPGTPTIKLLSGVPGSGVTPVVIATTTGATLTYTDNSIGDNSTKYYYLDITINGKRTMTSPIWYTRNDAFQAVNNVTPNQLANGLIINGNPIQDNLVHLSLYAAQTQRVAITIRDIAGRTIMTTPVYAVAGENKQDINVSALPAGTYVVTATFANETICKLIIK